MLKIKDDDEDRKNDRPKQQSFLGSFFKQGKGCTSCGDKDKDEEDHEDRDTTSVVKTFFKSCIAAIQSSLTVDEYSDLADHISDRLLLTTLEKHKVRHLAKVIDEMNQEFFNLDVPVIVERPRTITAPVGYKTSTVILLITIKYEPGVNEVQLFEDMTTCEALKAVMAGIVVAVTPPSSKLPG